MQKITELDQKSAVAEAFRTVRTNISFSDVDNEVQTILFTSTKQNEGKSTVIANVAYSFSKLENCKVLLMDLDLRNPTVHKMFGVSNTYGLMDNLKKHLFEKHITVTIGKPISYELATEEIVQQWCAEICKNTGFENCMLPEKSSC